MLLPIFAATPLGCVTVNSGKVGFARELGKMKGDVKQSLRRHRRELRRLPPEKRRHFNMHVIRFGGIHYRRRERRSGLSYHTSRSLMLGMPRLSLFGFRFIHRHDDEAKDRLAELDQRVVALEREVREREDQ